jgi:hypothetical protein
VTAELVGLGVTEPTARQIIKTMSARSVDELAGFAAGADEEGLNELKEMFQQVLPVCVCACVCVRARGCIPCVCIYTYIHPHMNICVSICKLYKARPA